MKLATFLTICVALAVSAPSGVAGNPPKPRLVVASTAPLALKGSGFKPRESVRLVVTSGAVTVRRVLRASATGRFSVSFETVSVDRCSGGITARAIGRAGSSAVAKLGPMAECPPAP